MRDYQPFAYPPDYQLARIHQQASMPGKVLPKDNKYCPCCQLPVRYQFKNWVKRSIQNDFCKFGGSVVTYFWLIKLYAFISALVLAIYSVYLVVCIHQFCSYEQKCQKIFSFWIVSNQDLYQIILQKNHRDIIIRLFTLRGMTYVILLFGNAASLYIVARFKRRYPPPKNISAFALIFKSINKSPEDFTLELKQKYPNLQIKELFSIRKLQPFYSQYYKKITLYYDCLNEQSNRKKIKLISKLAQLDKLCQKAQQSYNKAGNRIILVVNQEQSREQILKQYKITLFDNFKYILGFNQDKTYCQPCPIPQEIIWNHIGEEEKQKIKTKVLSVFYFFLLLLGSYGMLFFCMKIVYRKLFPDPWNTILVYIILTILVIIALIFRYLMNQLSEMRLPNTQTSRTMFIVLTTVLFHFIYYLIIPTFYFWLAQDFRKNKTLLVITQQGITFIVCQFIITVIDIMHCCWMKRQKKVQNQAKPIGCQKILHNQIQYHRFPIQFKLIILFKTFSFIIFFAFQIPLCMFLTFILLIYLYFKDKHSVYYHYRMEIIDNSVQFKFLKIYSNFFTIYTFIIFVLTQHIQVQFWIAFGLMIFAMIVQTFFINERKIVDQTVLPESMHELGFTDSYRKRYNKFMQDVINDKLDLKMDMKAYQVSNRVDKICYDMYIFFVLSYLSYIYDQISANFGLFIKQKTQSLKTLPKFLKKQFKIIALFAISFTYLFHFFSFTLKFNYRCVYNYQFSCMMHNSDYKRKHYQIQGMDNQIYYTFYQIPVPLDSKLPHQNTSQGKKTKKKKIIKESWWKEQQFDVIGTEKMDFDIFLQSPQNYKEDFSTNETIMLSQNYSCHDYEQK